MKRREQTTKPQEESIPLLYMPQNKRAGVHSSPSSPKLTHGGGLQNSSSKVIPSQALSMVQGPGGHTTTWLETANHHLHALI